jgi:hypothetical protein
VRDWSSDVCSSDLELQKTMTTNNVGSVSPTTITADTSTTPANAGSLGKGEKKEDEEPKDFPIFLVLGLCMGVGACLVVGGYLCYRRQQKEKMLAKHVTEMVEQRQHDAMNNNPMNTHEHKKKRRSSSAFPGQEVTMGTKSWCWNKQHQNQLLTFTLTIKVDVGILLIESQW